MQSVSFEPSVEDLLAAQRLNFIMTVKSRRTVRIYIIGSVVLGALAAAMFWVWDLGPVPRGFVIGLAYWPILFSALLASSYLQLPRRGRRVFAQQKSLHELTTVEWSDDGLSFSSSRGHARFYWTDFIAIARGRDAIILRRSDALMNFIPTRILSEQQADDIAAKGLLPAY